MLLYFVSLALSMILHSCFLFLQLSGTVYWAQSTVWLSSNRARRLNREDFNSEVSQIRLDQLQQKLLNQGSFSHGFNKQSTLIWFLTKCRNQLLRAALKSSRIKQRQSAKSYWQLSCCCGDAAIATLRASRLDTGQWQVFNVAPHTNKKPRALASRLSWQ